MTLPNDILLNYTVPGEPGLVLVPLGAFVTYLHQKMELMALFGTAIGAASILVVLLWVVIKNKRTPIYVLSQVTLVLLLIRSGLFVSHLMSPAASLGLAFTGIVGPTGLRDVRVSAAASAFQTLLVASIEASMVYQVFIIFQSPEVKALGWILTCAFGLLSIAVFGLYVNSAVVVSRAAFATISDVYADPKNGTWVTDVPFILYSVSVTFMSVLLLAKLGLAIRTRRYLGLRQFDSLHILFIAASQTLIGPAILALIKHGVASPDSASLLSNLSVMLSAITLPISIMWASSANNSPTPSSSAVSMLRRSNSNTSENTLASSAYSFFPKKLSKVSTNGSDDLEKGSAHTVAAVPLTPVPLNESPTVLNEIDRILNAEQDLFHLDDSTVHAGTKRADRVLDNLGEDAFKSVTSHNRR